MIEIYNIELTLKVLGSSSKEMKKEIRYITIVEIFKGE